MHGRRWFIWSLAAGVAALALLVGAVGLVSARESIARLLDTSQTVIAQPIAYPTRSPARIFSAIVTMQPGEETGWHRHDVPMFGYILEGEVSVDYGTKGRRVYRQGDAVMEALDWPHNGRNTGSGPARILAVFMGAEGVPNTVMLPGGPTP